MQAGTARVTINKLAQSNDIIGTVINTQMQAGTAKVTINKLAQ